MNVAEERKTFIEAMQVIQDDRKKEIGAHIWKRHLNRYGAPAYFYELAGILSRLEELIIHHDPAETANYPKLLDLLTDMGNYTGFLYEWVEEQRQRQLGGNDPLAEFLP